METREDRLKIAERLREQDQAPVIFGKIAFYCDIVQKASPNIKQRLFEDYEGFLPLVRGLFKV